MEVTSQNKIKYILKATLFCVVFIVLLVVFSFAKSFLPNSFERLAHGIVGTLAAFITTILFLKFDRRRFSDIGLVFKQNTVVKFFAGVLIGVLIMGLLALSVIYVSVARIDLNPKSNALQFLLVTLPLFPLAFLEELAFRAYPLEILKNKLGIRISIVITSILFALYHIPNGWTVASSFLGPAIWGLIFGLAAVYSKGIAMPTGIHYAANLTTAALGSANNTFSIWTVEVTEKAATKYQGVDWITILPALALLVFALLCIELYVRRKTTFSKSLNDQR